MIPCPYNQVLVQSKMSELQLSYSLKFGKFRPCILKKKKKYTYIAVIHLCPKLQMVRWRSIPLKGLYTNFQVAYNQITLDLIRLPSV